MEDNKTIRITFPLMVIIEVLCTWLVGKINPDCGIVMGFISAAHIIGMMILNAYVKKNITETNNEIN